MAVVSDRYDLSIPLLLSDKAEPRYADEDEETEAEFLIAVRTASASGFPE